MGYSQAPHFLKRWFFLLPFAGDWSYYSKDLWPVSYQTCGGNHQSPVALNSYTATENDLIQLEFHDYQKNLSAPVKIINNGIYAEIGLRVNKDPTRPYLTGNNFPDRYEIQAVHFHWGSPGVLGSEHSIDGKQARKHPDGFIVLGVLFKAIEYEHQERHTFLRSVYDSLEHINKYNSTAEVNGPFTMTSFLPDFDTNDFFVYKGSLTTPSCSESVLWFVFREVLTVPYDELKKFWVLEEGTKGRPLLNNFRNLQKSNRDRRSP